MNFKKAVIVLGIFLIAALGYWVQSSSKPLSDVGPAPTDDRLPISVSFYPLAEFTQQVGQEHVSVFNLTPAGSEPHDFEPSPQDIVNLNRSRLLMYNGANFEPWIDQLQQSLASSVIVVNTSEHLPLLISHNQPDPHVWLDPVLASQQVTTITQALQAVDPEHAAAYDRNRDSFQQQLQQLDQEFEQGLAKCQRRQVVTSHNAFQYLAQRYNLEVISLSGLSPDEEPSPQVMAQTVEFMKTHHLTHVFFESLVSPKLAETIAQEIGAQTLVFNPIEGFTPEELAAGKTYLSAQRENLAALRLALECQ